MKYMYAYVCMPTNIENPQQVHLISMGPLRSCKIEHLDGVDVRAASPGRPRAAMGQQSERKEQPNADFLVH